MVYRLLQKKVKKTRVRMLAGVALSIAGLVAAGPLGSIAASTSLAPVAKVSFTFDDGLVSSLNKAAPTLAKYGFTGTNYAITGCVGTTGTCPADKAAKYMTWAQLTTLQNSYGWEIGSHTVKHPKLTTVSTTRLQQELANSKAALQSHGFAASSFASPYGDYNNTVLSHVSKYYSSHRPFADQQYYNSWPYNDYLLYVKQVQAGVTVDQVKSYIDEAKQKNAWLVLVFHNIADSPSANPDNYEYGTNQLDQIAAYVQSRQMPVVNVSQGLAGAGGTNLLPNSSFTNGISNGWTTDVATSVTADSSNNGSFPEATKSVSIASVSGRSVHLFSPKVNVDSTKSYFLRNFLNVTQRSAGQVVFYIDEYDANGNWISGRIAAVENSVYVENVNFTYKPTSTNVKQASIQVAVDNGSNLKAYVDNMEWFEQQ